MNRTATLLAEHRGYKVTDEPYGSEPFTIYSPDGKVIDHCDDETLAECLTTIDVIQDEIEAEQERKDDLRWYPGACFDSNYPENASNIRA